MERQIGEQFRRCKYGLGEIQVCTDVAVVYSMISGGTFAKSTDQNTIKDSLGERTGYYRPMTMIKGTHHWYDLDEVIFLNKKVEL